MLKHIVYVDVRANQGIWFFPPKSIKLGRTKKINNNMKLHNCHDSNEHFDKRLLDYQIDITVASGKVDSSIGSKLSTTGCGICLGTSF